MYQNQNNIFYNSNLPSDLNKFLNIMLVADISYKKELIKQLNNVTLKRIDRGIGFLAYVFDVVDYEQINYKNIKSPAIDMLVYQENQATTEFLLHWSEWVKELEIINSYGEEYLELEDFNNIEFL